MINTDMPNKVHEGKNIKRFREMLGMKQDALAFELGDDWNQKKVSLLEGKETVDPEILEQVAKILKVSPEAIKNFNEEAAINIISNTFSHNQQAGAYIVNNNPTFNPIDKIVQLYDEKIELYERMLASEKEKNELLQGKQPKK
ncbi:transcriptional regulator with XRE-family HTH domain [Chitinophaga terrae (ex Kim and Jung 2007)]|uniref:helix-turn-helix transcriptional regulator n=1 Tax=Chitinophaga terrae (ex Kim and Jung 2007) TaxID=408074 RepID=UPI002786B09B|nr:helix-turn-helix transcriptional regulator [Chitinophaga terrae (ex Kim and Jung 2007)]MDQ0108483.1 transcriptional regulator with XRE-family HTH domain [Chitinophaga terrae (ex Kim and Jung 2007)]